MDRCCIALDEMKIADSTLIVLSSDNGGYLEPGANNGNLRDGKGSMYEGGPVFQRLFVGQSKSNPVR